MITGSTDKMRTLVHSD